MIEREEFEKILLGNNLDPACDEIKKLLMEIPGAAAMEGFNQRNPHHCHDLLTHTLYTINAIETSGITDDETKLLKVAAFFHDIGKPRVAAERNGRLVYFGHAEASAGIALEELESLGYTKNEIKRIIFYIKHHDMFIGFDTATNINHRKGGKTPITVSTVEKAMARVSRNEQQEVNPLDFLMLLRLSAADVMAQSSVVVQNGIVKDTREKKLMRVEWIRAAIIGSLLQSGKFFPNNGNFEENTTQ